MNTIHFVIGLVVLLSVAINPLNAACVLQDNTDYDSGYLTMLYQVPNATECCNACGSFQDCYIWSYVKDPGAGEWYQRCFIKNEYQATTEKVSASNVAGLNPNPPAPPKSSCEVVETGVDYDNGWLSLLENVPSYSLCCDACSNYPGCKAWVYSIDPSAGDWYHRCYLKSSNSNRKINNGTIAGTSISALAPPTSSSKKGIAWFNTQACSDLTLMKSISWYYNWASLPDVYTANCALKLGIEFTPMIWGLGSMTDLNLTIWSDASYILGFNEPNFYAQSNVLPKQAATIWPQIEAIAKTRNMKIGSPSASACGPNATIDCYGQSWWPTQWFDDFFSNCSNCQVDFLTTHIYTCNITEFTNYLTVLINRYKLKVWLTEFSCPNAGQSIDIEVNFMKQALAFLEGNSMIERYAWFGTRLPLNDDWLGPGVDLFQNWSSQLSQIGVLYNS